MSKSSVRRLSTERSQRRSVELLVAARQVFETQGYFDTKVADIVLLADASHGTFYKLFRQSGHLTQDAEGKPTLPAGVTVRKALLEVARTHEVELGHDYSG